MKEQTKGECKKTYPRRMLLKSSPLVSAISMSGCLGIFRHDSSNEKSTERRSQTATPTSTESGYKTRTFRATPDEHPGQLVLSGGGGPINMEVFSDYAHEESMEFWTQTQNKLREYYTSDPDTGGEPKITIVLRHFPEPVNKWSMILPCAMMEVRAQMDVLAQKEFHERLFENHYPDYSISDVKIAANMVGADSEEVVKAGKERRRSYAIKWHIEKGEGYGLEEPLGVVVDGDPVEENTAEAIEEAIERAL